MGVKFGMEEVHAEGPLLRAKFHPHRCNNNGVGPQILKFLLRFDQNSEYKRPAGVYRLRDFHEICIICRVRYLLKFGCICSRGYESSYGGFKLRGLHGFPQIFCAP